MITVGVRDLKQQTSEIIRQVRTDHKEIQVTYHGRVVARIIPVENQPGVDQTQNWVEIDNLAAKIGRKWPEGVSAAQAVEEGG